MRVYALELMLIFSALGLGGCMSADRYAFIPNRTFAIPEDELPDNVRHVFIEVDDGERAELFLVERPEKPARRLVVYFHGNAGNIAQRVPHLRELATRTRAAVLGVGYRGFGASDGRASEQSAYKDGEAAVAFATGELGIASEAIVVLGRSIGSAVAAHTAAEKSVGGVVLVTPLTSLRAMARKLGYGPLVWLARESFNNLEHVQQIEEPVLIIHGTEDEIVPYTMGQEVFEALQSPKRFVTIEGGRHNDLEHTDPTAYWSAIAEFVQSVTNQDL